VVSTALTGESLRQWENDFAEGFILNGFQFDCSVQIGSATQFENPTFTARLTLHAFDFLIHPPQCSRSFQSAQVIAFILGIDFFVAVQLVLLNSLQMSAERLS
jgi:hypothetical protein